MHVIVCVIQCFHGRKDFRVPCLTGCDKCINTQVFFILNRKGGDALALLTIYLVHKAYLSSIIYQYYTLLESSEISLLYENIAPLHTQHCLLLACLRYVTIRQWYLVLDYGFKFREIWPPSARYPICFSLQGHSINIVKPKRLLLYSKSVWYRQCQIDQSI